MTFQKQLLRLWPTANAAYTISGIYTINPYRLTSALPYPMGGLPLSECLREACLAACELEFKGEPGIHMGMFMKRLQSAVSRDRQMNTRGCLGNMNQGVWGNSQHRRGPNAVHIGLNDQLYV